MEVGDVSWNYLSDDFSATSMTEDQLPSLPKFSPEACLAGVVSSLVLPNVVPPYGHASPGG